MKGAIVLFHPLLLHDNTLLCRVPSVNAGGQDKQKTFYGLSFSIFSPPFSLALCLSFSRHSLVRIMLLLLLLL